MFALISMFSTKLVVEPPYCKQIVFPKSDWPDVPIIQLNSKKRLKNISFPGGRIDINYSFEREDISTPTSLDYAVSSISVENINQENIKEVKFNYSYFLKGNEKTRLKLDRIDIKDINRTIGSYGFTYNSGQLPSHNSYEYDFLGYYNGKGAPNDESKIYALISPNIKDTRYLPFFYEHWNWPQNDVIVFNSGDRKPDEAFAKMGMLNKITYPTGGSLELEYEINKADITNVGSFDYPGLRIKGQKVTTGADSYIKTYEYFGHQAIIPTFGMLTVDKSEMSTTPTILERNNNIADYSTIFYQNQLNYDLYKGYTIVYQNVKEIFQDNSYIRYTYDSPRDASPTLFKTGGCYLLSYYLNINPTSGYPFIAGNSNISRRGVVKWRNST